MEIGTDRFYIDLGELPFPSIMREMANSLPLAAGVRATVFMPQGLARGCGEAQLEKTGIRVTPYTVEVRFCPNLRLMKSTVTAARTINVLAALTSGVTPRRIWL